MAVADVMKTPSEPDVTRSVLPVLAPEFVLVVSITKLPSASQSPISLVGLSVWPTQSSCVPNQTRTLKSGVEERAVTVKVAVINRAVGLSIWYRRVSVATVEENCCVADIAPYSEGDDAYISPLKAAAPVRESAVPAPLYPVLGEVLAITCVESPYVPKVSFAQLPLVC